MSLRPFKKKSIYRFKASALSESAEEDILIEEKPLTIVVHGIGSFTILCTPIDLPELAVGFIFAEGIIETFADIIEIDCSKLNQLIITIKVKNPEKALSKKNLVITSGCALCSTHNIDNILLAISPLPNTLKILPKQIPLLAAEVFAKQQLFKQTGAAHATAIFDKHNNIVAMNEDLARHNALDKTIGYCILNKISLKNCGVFLSSRISFEMVVKAARAGLEIILAVSAPSALAIKAAEYWNVTLCGFVRGDSGNIYTGKQRFISST